MKWDLNPARTGSSSSFHVYTIWMAHATSSCWLGKKNLERHCKDSWNAHQGWASSDQFPDSKARGFWSDLEHKWTIQLFRSVKYQKTDRSLHKLHKFKNSTICLSQNVKTCMSPGSTTCAIKPYGITQKFPPDHRPWDSSPQEGNSLPIEVVV